MLHEPISPVTTNGRCLILMLHGVGSTGSSFAPLARRVCQHFPDAIVRMPDAPFEFDGGQGRQWFSIDGVTEANRLERVKDALNPLADMVDKELAETGISADRLTLVGFSQGAIMALQYILAGYRTARVIAISGRLAGRPTYTGKLPPIELIHGTADPIMPIDLAASSSSTLEKLGAEVALRAIPGLGHTIDERVMECVIQSIYRDQPSLSDAR